MAKIIKPDFQTGPREPKAVGHEAGEITPFDPLARLEFLDVPGVTEDLWRFLRVGWTDEAAKFWREHIDLIEPKLRLAGYRDDDARRRAIAAHTDQVRKALAVRRLQVRDRGDEIYAAAAAWGHL